jgi:excisionase family DNA binding protein
MSALAEIAVQWEEKVHPGTPGSADKVLLTTDEAAERLGVGRSTLYTLIRSGTLRTVKIGRRRLVPITAIPELIQSLLEETEET